MQKLIFAITILFFSATSSALGAGSFIITGVKTDFAMADNQQLYRDVYVNIGTNQGVKPGSQLDVFRVVTSVDEANQRIGGNISFRFAKLKVIHSDGNISVARVMSFQPPESTPLSSYSNVMVGDLVELARK